MFDVSLAGAFTAGLLSFLSPCILPIVPFYLGYMAGQSVNSAAAAEGLAPGVRQRAVTGALSFSAGILTVFVAMGVTATAFGQLFREWMDILRYGAALIIFIMGLNFLGLIRIGLFYREFRADVKAGNQWNPVTAYVIGLAFAFGWTPCVGPVLAAILFTAAGEETVQRGALLLLTYGIGMTAPFVLAALFVGPFISAISVWKPWLGTVEKAVGVFLILFAILIGTNSVRHIAEFLLTIMPEALLPR